MTIRAEGNSALPLFKGMQEVTIPDARSRRSVGVLGHKSPRDRKRSGTPAIIPLPYRTQATTPQAPSSAPRRPAPLQGHERHEHHHGRIDIGNIVDGALKALGYDRGHGQAPSDLPCQGDQEAFQKVQNGGNINCVLMESGDELIAAAREVVRIKAAMDSGAVANVVHPEDLPCDAEPTPNLSSKHFVGASNSRIERFGQCLTTLNGQYGELDCDWQLADVTRALHSVSTVTGPKDGPGKQDVLFNNRRCVVVPPGVVEKILKHIKPIMEYEREGNLYTAEVTMSAFGRRGQEA